ncbi:MAG: anion permease, partial [Flavobacteriales bacterium]
MSILLILFIVVCFLAYSNGANDNFKGVATLFGSNTTKYKGAIIWATITTFLGSIVSIFLANELVQNFSGKGLIPQELVMEPEFALSIAFGAALTVFIATKIGMPISTTHGLVGGLFGSGVMAVGSSFNFVKLGSVFLIPLLVSPLMACIVSLIGYLIFKRLRIASGLTKESCICVDNEYKPLSEYTNEKGEVQINSDSKCHITASIKEKCEKRYIGKIVGINAQKVLDYAHYLSAGVVSFSRGLNDTPKMVGLLLVLNTMNIKWGMISVTVAIAVGGLVNARKVGETVSKKVTSMNHGQGFTANMFTGLLVTT